ncbi:MAG TPA: glycosyltransferase [Anaerolineales bacterium]|nr:glycosyltransferase [Anaerolineales bacterium]
MTKLSVVIPALNETDAIPRLLDALKAQTRPADEVIVADAGSKDNTPELARERGAIVVRGGRPGPGRNAGARAATGDLLFFLDADVAPRPDFFEKALNEFERSGFVVATTLTTALENDLPNQVLAEAANLYLQVVQYFSPHAPGFCILVKRSVHKAIGGFDEQVKLAEDHDYVQRAAKQGDFGVLTGAHIPVSMRRLEKEGLTKLALKYLWCEMHALAGKPIYSTPFEYEFGAHRPSTGELATTRRLVDISQLREQLGRFENPISFLSETGRGRLDELMRADWVQNVRERFPLKLERPDLDALHRYLLRRLALIRATPRPLEEVLAKLQTAPLKENIRLLDLNWLLSRVPGTGRLAANKGKPESSDSE